MNLPSLSETSTSREEWNVFVALADRFHNPFAIREKDDTGELAWEPGQICVRGGRRPWHFRGVSSLATVRQNIPWLYVILGNLLMVGMTIGCLKTFTPSDPLTWVLIGAINAFGFAVTKSTRWIRVTHRSESGAEEFVYLLPVTSSGFRTFGTADRLLAMLQKEVIRPSGGE